MDKYEYKLKLEEIETLAGEKNYAAAAEIADSINWRKVRNEPCHFGLKKKKKTKRKY